ncbi:MAG: hypothetical protein ACK55V_11785 [Alphaproteobacteria bacterium]|jgi:hypothetical protein
MEFSTPASSPAGARTWSRRCGGAATAGDANKSENDFRDFRIFTREEVEQLPILIYWRDQEFICRNKISPPPISTTGRSGFTWIGRFFLE